MRNGTRTIDPDAARELARRVAAEFLRQRREPAPAVAAVGGTSAAGGRVGTSAAPRRERAPAGALAGGGSNPEPPAEPGSLAEYVDHTLLAATTTSADIVKLCREADAHGFAAVCVNPVWVDLAVAELGGSATRVATVIGFPLGASTPESKAAESEDALRRGARELDMVAQIGKIKEGDWVAVSDDVRAVVETARGRAQVKVILETAALEPMEMIKAAALCAEAGADFVKTSTGFHPAGGASAEAVALLRMAVGAHVGVKASGGIRSCEDALRMIAAGATRLGTSSGVELVACYGHLAPPIEDAVRRLGYAPPKPALVGGY